MTKSSLLFVLCFLTTHSYAQILYNLTNIEQRRSEVINGMHKEAYKHLIANANIAITHPLRSVMDKKHIAISGDKHDYCSLSFYAWPDETKPNGLPYTVKDGQPNPEYKEYDYENLVRLSNDINTLALAWYFSGKDEYAQKATQMLRVWFIDKNTAMNPNLWYCQINPGKNNGEGNNVLDGSCVADLLNGVLILEQSTFLKKNEKKKLKNWITKFCNNIQATDWGRNNTKYVNNQAVAYDKQIATYLIYTGKKEQAINYLKTFPERRLFKQLAPDGSFPAETTRNRSFYYSWYNLQFLIDVYIISKNAGFDLKTTSDANGQNICSAIDYLIKFIGKPKSDWPYQEIGDWEAVQSTARKELYRIAHALDSQYKSALDAFDPIPQNDIYRLIY